MNSPTEYKAPLGDKALLSNLNGKDELDLAYQELSVLGQISEALAQAPELDKILKIILTGVTANQGLGFNRAFLFLVDDSGSNLIGRLAIGPRSAEEAGQIWSELSHQENSLSEILGEYLKRESNESFTLSSLIEDWSIPLDQDNFCGLAALKGQTLNIKKDLSLSELSINIFERLGAENVAVAPIIQNGRQLGLIVADNQITGKNISVRDLRLLQTFANHTAVAIERSSLYEGLVEYTGRLEANNRLLKESQDQLIRIEKLSVIGELTSSIAHELRNPLTVIGGFTNLILSAENQKDCNEYLNIILSEAKRAELVLDQVLDFSRASRGENIEIDLGALLSKTYNVLTARLNNNVKPPKLNLPDYSINIFGNSDQLQHAFYQFMNIAVEDTTEQYDVLFNVEAQNDQARFTINFDGDEPARKAAKKNLAQLFGTATGAQKLTIIVAGETIKYHGGSFGVEADQNNPPAIYIELPIYKESYDG